MPTEKSRAAKNDETEIILSYDVALYSKQLSSEEIRKMLFREEGSVLEEKRISETCRYCNYFNGACCLATRGNIPVSPDYHCEDNHSSKKKALLER